MIVFMLLFLVVANFALGVTNIVFGQLGVGLFNLFLSISLFIVFIVENRGEI